METTLSYKTKTGFYRPHKKVTQDNLYLDPKTGELTEMPSMTKQSFRDQCDINNILKQYKTTGMIAHMRQQASQGRYMDLPDPIDFQESMNIVIEAEASFASLPSGIRNRFGNDPMAFLEFIHDPKNSEEVYAMGLAVKPVPADPTRVEVVNAPSSPGEQSGREAPASTSPDTPKARDR